LTWALRGLMAFGIGRAISLVPATAKLGSLQSAPQRAFVAAFVGGLVAACIFFAGSVPVKKVILGALGFGIGFSAPLLFEFLRWRAGQLPLDLSASGLTLGFALVGAIGGSFIRPQLGFAAAAAFGIGGLAKFVCSFLEISAVLPEWPLPPVVASYLPYCLGGALFGVFYAGGGTAKPAEAPAEETLENS
jgi:hypothetical protein